MSYNKDKDEVAIHYETTGDSAVSVRLHWASPWKLSSHHYTIHNHYTLYKMSCYELVKQPDQLSYCVLWYTIQPLYCTFDLRARCSFLFNVLMLSPCCFYVLRVREIISFWSMISPTHPHNAFCRGYSICGSYLSSNNSFNLNVVFRLFFKMLFQLHSRKCSPFSLIKYFFSFSLWI